MAIVDSNLTISWDTKGILITEREFNLLFEIFGPFPVHNEYTLRSGIIGLGKSRILVANQDQLLNALIHYLDLLSVTQQQRVKELIAQYDKLALKVVKFATAERVRFRVNAPEEQRDLIRQKIQTYIPIFRTDEVENLAEGLPPGAESNEIMRG